MSRAYTVEETRNKLLEHIKLMVQYWDKTAQKQTQSERLDGLEFSILTALDGCARDVPAFKLICDPHPDDKAFLISEGENWYEPVDITEGTMLHELWHKVRSVV